MFKVGDRVQYVNQNSFSRWSGRLNKTAIITNEQSIDSRHITVQWDDGYSECRRPLILSLKKVGEMSNFSNGDRVKVVRKGDRYGQQGVVQGTTDSGLIKVKLDGCYSYSDSLGYFKFKKTSLENLSRNKTVYELEYKVKSVSSNYRLRRGDLVRIKNPSIVGFGKVGEVISDSTYLLTDSWGEVKIKFVGNGGTTYVRVKNLVVVEKSVTDAISNFDVKELAKAYFTNDKAAVEKFLKPYYVKPLPTGAILSAPDLSLAWVVTDKGVVSVDTKSGTATKSDKTVAEFTKYAEENGVITRLDKV